jgi:pimeloyl-ACP methyl ester carboxylesterase
MNLIKLTTCLLFFFNISQAQKPKPVFVIVHGAWGGSWAFKKTDSLLREKGCIVYRPSLTGQGERVHLASKDIGLQTHINDVVNTILYEDLRNVVLVGHSYGGMVITGVADSLADRIKTIIYLDAFLPNSGESLIGIRGMRADGMRQMAKDGFVIPVWQRPNASPPKDVPHPFKTLSDTLIVKGRAQQIPTIYILTVDPGKEAKADDFFDQSERARARGWKILTMQADHNPQRSKVDELVKLLYENK